VRPATRPSDARLTHALFDRRTALIAGVLYAFPPAPAPLSAPYTETGYALATFAGFYGMATRRWWAAALAFAAATSVRATGVFTTLPLAYALLAPALRHGIHLVS
jgi:phosphatidylinositol glycan class V